MLLSEESLMISEYEGLGVLEKFLFVYTYIEITWLYYKCNVETLHKFSIGDSHLVRIITTQSMVGIRILSVTFEIGGSALVSIRLVYKL